MPATHNEHKRREFARLLAAAGDGRGAARRGRAAAGGRQTFAENALGKARAAAAGDRAARAIADDSGIAAAALGGRPGCARRATPASTPATRRTSRSCCARRPPAARSSTSARSPRRSRPWASSACSRGAAPVRSPREPRGEREVLAMTRLLPDDGPPRLTMAELLAEPRRTRSATAAAPRARCSALEQRAGR